MLYYIVSYHIILYYVIFFLCIYYVIIPHLLSSQLVSLSRLSSVLPSFYLLLSLSCLNSFHPIIFTPHHTSFSLLSLPTPLLSFLPISSLLFSSLHFPCPLFTSLVFSSLHFPCLVMSFFLQSCLVLSRLYLSCTYSLLCLSPSSFSLSFLP